MKRFKLTGCFASVLLSVCILVPAFAQRLPQGKYHQIREREIDIVHYKAALSFDFASREIHGTAFISFRPLHSLKTFFLDAHRLRCKQVMFLQGGKSTELPYKISGDSIRIQLAQTFSSDDTVTVAIQYAARPNAGLYFIKDQAHPGQFFIYTYGEGGLHKNWLPIYNEVNDKFSSEMVVTVPPPYTVISNGKLLDVQKEQDNSRTFHWKQNLPHSNYLIALYVGEFEKGDLPAAFGDIPLHYWVPAGKLRQGAYAFRNTKKMVEFFSNRFNYRYPWDKYDQIAVPDFAVGAMEHTGVTGHRACVLRGEDAPVNFGPPDFDRYFTVWSNDNIISHELSHHWFGDNLTFRSLNYLWLNESFATYCQMLYDEYALGEEAFDFIRQEALDRYFNYVRENHKIRPLEYAYYDATSQMYTIPVTYFKGALVLHTLRRILGDEPFFNTLNHFLREHEFANVISSDFNIAIQETTGKNLSWFFDDWITGGGFPVFDVDYSYHAGEKMLDLHVRQIQPVIAGQGLFTLPVEISVITAKGNVDTTVWVKNNRDQFRIHCPEQPRMVSFDGDGALVAEIHFNKSLQELLFQIENDRLPGKLRAMRQLAQKYPVEPATLQLFSHILAGQEFWGLKAEAALLLGKIRTKNAEKLILQGLKKKDYKIRKAAVLALPKFPPKFAEKTLRTVIRNDKHADVVATAIVALAKAAPGGGSADFIRQQMKRPAWYDEIKLACLQAFAVIADERLLKDIKPFTGDKYHEFMQKAALSAWKSCAPEDPELHRVLMEKAENGKPGVRIPAMEMLGQLQVSAAAPVLTKINEESGDVDERVAAENALREIKRK